MAHNVETMAYAGELPWHGLGTKINEGISVEDMLKAAELDWTVSLQPMYFNKNKVVADHQALVRDSDETLLDVVGNRYVPVQNHELFAFFDSFVKETKLELHTAGSLCSGKHIWALAKDKRNINVAKGDAVESYVLLVNSHQLGKRLIAKPTTVRVVCNNTLNLALKDGTKQFAFTHCRQFDETAHMEAAKVLGLLHDAQTEFRELAEVLQQVKVKELDIRTYFKQVLNLPVAANKPIKLGSKKLVVANTITKEDKAIEELVQAYTSAPGQKLPGADGTLWGALNAVTYVLDHGGRAKGRSDNRLRDNWLGWRDAVKQRAVKIANQMAEAA